MNRKGNLYAKRKLAHLIDGYMSAGQRGDGLHRRTPKPWSNVDLAGFVGQAELTVRSWRNVDNPVTPDEIDRILDHFFGDVPKFALKRQELLDAWLAAKSKVTLNIDDLEDRFANEPLVNWKVTTLEQTEGLVELRLHQPRMANDGNSFYLDATLRLDRARYDYEGREVYISMKNATLIIESPSHQPAKGSMIGERTAMVDVVVRPHGVEFTAMEGGYLCGDILQGEYVASMESLGGEVPERVLVSLHAGRRAFIVEASEPNNSEENLVIISAEKETILNTLIHCSRKKDRLGRTILARSRLRK